MVVAEDGAALPREEARAKAKAKGKARQPAARAKGQARGPAAAAAERRADPPPSPEKRKQGETDSGQATREHTHTHTWKKKTQQTGARRSWGARGRSPSKIMRPPALGQPNFGRASSYCPLSGLMKRGVWDWGLRRLVFFVGFPWFGAPGPTHSDPARQKCAHCTDFVDSPSLGNRFITGDFCCL